MSATAERLARHLETNYGLQLDEYRRRVLIEEIDLFFSTAILPSARHAVPAIHPMSKQGMFQNLTEWWKKRKEHAAGL